MYGTRWCILLHRYTGCLEWKGGERISIWRIVTFSGHDVIQDPGEIAGHPGVDRREAIAAHPRAEGNDAYRVDSLVASIAASRSA